MKKVPFIKIELPLLYRDDLSLADKVIFGRLELYARKSGVAYMAVETLASECRLGIRTTQESLRALQEAGMITREDRWRETAIYRISGVAKSAEPKEKADGVAKLATAKSAPYIEYQKGVASLPPKNRIPDTSRAESENDSENGKRDVSDFDSKTEQLGQPDASSVLDAPVVPIGTSSTDPAGSGSAEPKEPPASSSPSPKAIAGAARESHGSGQTGLRIAKFQEQVKKDRLLDADPPTGTSREAVALVRALAKASEEIYPRCRFPVSPDDYGFAEMRIQECPNLDPVAEAGKFLNQFKGRLIRSSYKSRLQIRFSDFSIWLREKFRGRFKTDPIEARKVVFH